MPFKKTVADNAGNLVIQQVQSPNFDAAQHVGWQIERNGDATFGIVEAFTLISGNTAFGFPINVIPWLEAQALFNGAKTSSVTSVFNTSLAINTDVGFDTNTATWNFGALSGALFNPDFGLSTTPWMHVTYNMDIEHIGAGTSLFIVNFYYDRPAQGVLPAQARVPVATGSIVARTATNNRQTQSVTVKFPVPLTNGQTTLVQLGAQARCSVAGDQYRINSGSSWLSAHAMPGPYSDAFSL